MRLSRPLRILAVAIFAVGSFKTPALGQSVTVGDETRANAITEGGQDDGDVCLRPDGSFVVVWEDGQPSDPERENIALRRFDAAGAPLDAVEIVANSYTTDRQLDPRVCCRDDGSVVVVWAGEVGDGFLNGIATRLFDADGVPLGGEVLVNAYTTGQQSGPSVACIPSGQFVVTWNTPYTGYSGDVAVRRFGADGTPAGDEVIANASTGQSQMSPAVAALPDGGFVVVWQSNHRFGSSYDIEARRFDALDAPVDALEFQVNAYTTNDQYRPVVGADAAGNFVVVWQSQYQDVERGGVFAQRFASDGTALGDEFQVNTQTTADETIPEVAVDDEGRFVVTWASYTEFSVGFAEYYDRDVRARAFASDGTPLDPSDFQVNTYDEFTGGGGEYESMQEDPRVAVGSGAFVIVWESEEQDGDDEGMYLQRYALPADVAVTLVAVPDPVDAADPLTYRVTVENLGDAAAIDVVMTDTLPPEVVFLVAETVQGSCSEAEGVVTCQLGTLAPANQVEVEIGVRAPDEPGSITNAASVTAATGDTDLGNNDAEITTEVRAVADVGVLIADDPDPVGVGEPLTYTITVPNLGPSTATDVELVVALPDGVRIVSIGEGDARYAADAGNVTVAFPSLPPGTVGSFTITVVSDVEGTLTTTATVTANEADGVAENNTATEETTVAPPLVLTAEASCLAACPGPRIVVRLTGDNTRLTDSTLRVASGVPVRFTLLSESVPPGAFELVRQLPIPANAPPAGCPLTFTFEASLTDSGGGSTVTESFDVEGLLVD